MFELGTVDVLGVALIALNAGASWTLGKEFMLKLIDIGDAIGVIIVGHTIKVGKNPNKKK
jgi:hypothetical protein